MDISEINKAGIEFEKDHWWIKSRFRIIDKAISEFNPERPLAILEAGCGTGINLYYLRKRYGARITKLLGVDREYRDAPLHAECIQKELPEEKEKFDLVLIMDVLEHTEEPVAFLKNLRSRLLPEGKILVTTPAFPWLWSRHDELLGHKRRYTLRSLKEELSSAGYCRTNIFYAFGIIFPLFLAVRFFAKLFPGSVKKTITPHPALANRLLYKISSWEIRAFWKQNLFWGSSLIALGT
jgi:2-polyprenyl-3-methyl-5-hydroxy-6-metoxy-1,4-benzoquinol methylase